jgi:hypothetical protein
MCISFWTQGKTTAFIAKKAGILLLYGKYFHEGNVVFNFDY